jgi:hypothetical protein
MREERANLGRLQRPRRAAVDEDIARQQEAVERWTAQAAAVTEPETPARNEARPIVADPHEARLVLVARDEAFGERPSSFAAREAWAREAAQLVAAGTPTLDPTAQPVGVDDLGMDLWRPPTS